MLRIVDKNFEAVIDDSGDIKIIKENVKKNDVQTDSEKKKEEESK